MRARRGPHDRGALGDPLARGARRRVHEGERRLPARPLRRRVAKRLLQVGDRTGHAITDGAPRRRRGRHRHALPEEPARRARAQPSTAGARAAASTRSRPSTVILAAGGRCYAVAEERGELSTNHPGATGEVTQIALDAGAEARDLDALQYHPNGGAWPETMQGYSHPGDDARVRRRPPERRRRGVHRLARPARRRQPGDRRRGREGQGRRDARRPARRLPRHDAHLGARRRALAPVHAAPLPRGGNRPARGEDLHVPRPPLPERRPRDRRATPRRRSKASTPAARSPAARTGATG